MWSWQPRWLLTLMITSIAFKELKINSSVTRSLDLNRCSLFSIRTVNSIAKLATGKMVLIFGPSLRHLLVANSSKIRPVSIARAALTSSTTSHIWILQTKIPALRCPQTFERLKNTSRLGPRWALTASWTAVLSLLTRWWTSWTRRPLDCSTQPSSRKPAAISQLTLWTELIWNFE